MTELEKEQKYKQLLKEATALLDGETDLIANMANLAALIHETMGFWWTGFYIVRADKDGKEQLVLGSLHKDSAGTRSMRNLMAAPRDHSSTRC